MKRRSCIACADSLFRLAYSHLAGDATLDGVRYVQHPLGHQRSGKAVKLMRALGAASTGAQGEQYAPKLVFEYAVRDALASTAKSSHSAARADCACEFAIDWM